MDIIDQIKCLPQIVAYTKTSMYKAFSSHRQIQRYIDRDREKEMAELFIKQAKQYSETRPTYPEEVFQFIASKTPSHDLVWDVGTGSGQAAKSVCLSLSLSLKIVNSYRNLSIHYESFLPGMDSGQVNPMITGFLTND